MSYNFKDNLTIDNGKFLKWLDSTGTSRNNVLCVDSFNNTNIVSPNGIVLLSDTSPNSSILVQSKLAVGISNTANLSANLTIAKGGIIGINTTRGSNDSFLTISGSASQLNTDGSRIVLYGNQAFGSTGNLNLFAGNVNNGTINLHTANDSLKYQILNNGTSKFSPDGSATALLVEIGKTTIFNNAILSNNSNTIGSIITTGGNVGIGTTNPIYTLDVNGSIYASANLRSNLTIIGDTSVEFSGSFVAGNNVASPLDITGISFNTSQIRSFTVTLAITVSKGAPNLYSQVVIEGVQKNNTWDIFSSELGDDTGIVFSITAAGQLQYTSLNYASWVSTTFRWNAKAINLSGTFTQITLPTSGTQTLSGPINITSNTNATNTSSGALTVTGGAGIARDLIVGGTIYGTFWNTSIQTTSFSATPSHKNFMFLISGDSTITLLPATTAGVNFVIGFQKTDSVNTQINIISTSLIDDYSNYVLSTKNESIILISDGSNWRIMSSKIPVLASIYSIPGAYNFTVPNPITTIYACVFGAGGGGGSGDGNSGNGGGGGGYCEGPISVTPGQILTITVGAGGTAGNTGGSSFIGSLIANGGTPGGVNTNGTWGSTGTGGTSSGGIINRSGGIGGQAPNQVSGSGGGGGSAGRNGDGSAASGIIGGSGSTGYGGPTVSSTVTDGNNIRLEAWYREGGSGASGNFQETFTPGNNGGFPGGGGSGSGGATTAGRGGDGAVIIFY